MKVLVTIEIEHPEDCWWTQSFIVTLRWDRSPDRGWCWWLDDCHPTPLTEAIEEQVMEKACWMLDDATNAALDAEMDRRAG